MVKGSDCGPMGRGQMGKQKVYEILVQGHRVTFAWGMAEKAQRQVQVKVARSNQHALALALDKKWDKVGRGYRVALEA
jgi:predicted DNA-binding WGR domain protein